MVLSGHQERVQPMGGGLRSAGSNVGRQLQPLWLTPPSEATRSTPLPKIPDEVVPPFTDEEVKIEKRFFMRYFDFYLGCAVAAALPAAPSSTSRTSIIRSSAISRSQSTTR